ncbi:CsbD family protein [Streptomyces coffeae]|uniref:CsbD family protein n=1 Tax=Streptomyces coffeae TaxID=621382 RepID=A0ABS1NEY0_9ACTN|nr:CsbD family protein [Streptomyces coffeae]MBL1098630.1 CsbD family protein [Streptomyces coffeae]
MNVGKKMAHKAEELKGQAQKVFGRATGNRKVEAEGHGHQAKGGAKQVGEKIKDIFRR